MGRGVTGGAENYLLGLGSLGPLAEGVGLPYCSQLTS